MTGYVVVRAVGEREILDSAGIFICSYGGLDNSAWQDVDDLYYENMLSAELVAIRDNSIKNRIGNYSPGATDSVDDAFLLLNTCGEKKKKLQVIKISCIDKIEVSERSFMLCGGIDCYVDGFGSLLALGLHTRPDLFAEFFIYLNSMGLFTSLSVFYEYLEMYRNIMLRENLEPIDHWDDVCLYDVVPMVFA